MTFGLSFVALSRRQYLGKEAPTDVVRDRARCVSVVIIGRRCPRGYCLEEAVEGGVFPFVRVLREVSTQPLNELDEVPFRIDAFRGHVRSKSHQVEGGRNKQWCFVTRTEGSAQAIGGPLG